MKKWMRIVAGLAAVMVMTMSSVLLIHADNSPAHGFPGWSISYNRYTQLAPNQFEEYICAPNSVGGQTGQPPAKLMHWDSSIRSWRISINRADVLAANPNCQEPSYIDAQVDSFAPLSSTLMTQLYQQGDYRVMYPGRVATWTGLAISPSYIETGTVGSTGWGFQSGEPTGTTPDGQADPATYRTIAATFALVNSPDPLASQVVNGGLQARPQAFVYDFANGLTYEELLSDYSPEFFTHPHDYSIAWVRTGQLSGDKPKFDIVFYIDGDEVARWTNGRTELSKFAVAQFLGYPQVGAAAPINAKRWSQPRPAQIYAWANNSASSNGFVNNAYIPPVPLELTLKGMSIMPIDR